jgi:hypothetical protein
MSGPEFAGGDQELRETTWTTPFEINFRNDLKQFRNWSLDVPQAIKWAFLW